MASLRGHVVLRNPDTLLVETFGPGDDVPAWAAERITNPEVLAQESAPAPQDGPVEPPRAGRGASAKAWSAYAAELGVEVQDGATREDIIAAVDANDA